MNLHPYQTDHNTGDMIALHRHSAGYVSFILEGAYDEISTDGFWRCRAGDLIIHPPFHLHTNRSFTRRSRVLNFRIDTPVPELPFLYSYRVYHCDPHKSFDPARIDLSFLQHFVDGAEPVLRLGGESWIDEIADCLEQNPAARIGAIAESLGVTPEHASRTFRKRFAMSPAAFRGERRFRSALDQILRSRRALADIAQSAGFSDQAHMTRTIRAKTGIPPAQFRAGFA